jgi:hypothetical protein
MKCSICNNPIVLVPSAAERARKFGGKPSDYTKLFTTHPECFIAKVAVDTKKLIARLADTRSLTQKRNP